MTRPAIPTTMRTTPTVDRLIPLTDVVTMNFRIAPIAVNTKLEPIRSAPTSRSARFVLFKVFQAHTDPSTQSGKEPQMIILGIVLVVVGLVASIPILETIGVILLVIGAILWVLGSMGRAVGGRKHYY
jgi:Family of unknown function (DUF6131)